MTAIGAAIETGTTLDAHTADLVAAFKATAPHMGKDKYLPVFAGTLLEFKDGEFTLAATDRYTMAVSTVTADHVAGDGFRALVSADDCKRIVAYLRTVKGYPKIPVRVQGDRVTFGFDGDVSVRTMNGNFPPIERIMDNHKVGEVESLMFNGDYLARFATKNLKRQGDPSDKGPRFEFSRPGGPVRVTFGDHFRGCIMAMRDGDR